MADFDKTPPPVYPDPPGYQDQHSSQSPPPGYQNQQGYQSPPPGYQDQYGYQSPPPGYQGQQGYQTPPYGYQEPYGYQDPYYGQAWYYNRPIGFLEAYKLYWLNAFNFNDRTSRAGYWWAYLMNFIINIILSSIFTSTMISTMFAYDFDFTNPLAYAGLGAGSVIYTIWGLANLIPGLSITVRRLHDVNKTWPWIFIALIPIVGGIILIVILATAAKYPPENRFSHLPQV